MKDVQNMPDDRKIYIDKVGIKNLKLPITLHDKAHGTQSTIADVNFFVDFV